MRQPKASEVGGGSRTAGGAVAREQLATEIHRLRGRMTGVALRFARDPASAEDIVQNACEKALRHVDRFRGTARLSTWLHRIVVNESLMWLRSERRRRHRERPHDDVDAGADALATMPRSDPGVRLDDRRRSVRLREGLRRLPRDERDVLVRCGLDGLSYEAYAAETGIRPAAAKSRAFRGRRRLRAWLEDRRSPEARAF